MGVDVLIVNLTRFGDLLQSQAVIDDLNGAGHRVGLVCLDNFAGALPLLRNVEQAWPLNGADLLARIDADWRGAVAAIFAFAEQIRGDGKPKAILNLTPSLPARLLARLIATSQTEVRGFDLDPFGYGVNHGVWASFFSAAATSRVNSPFNLSDLLRMMAAPLSGERQGSFRLAEPDAGWGRDFLAAQNFAIRPQGFVGFQPGASEERRRWPIESFCELGEILWQKAGLAPILLGSSGEAPLGEKYADLARHPFINAIGKTDLRQLPSLLKQCRLLATNDTGTMHLAAGLGVPVLAFFLATAQPWDTGPLLPGSISLEPDLDCHPCPFRSVCDSGNRCRDRISPRTAAFYALRQLGHADDSFKESATEARAWRTIRDDDGFLDLASLNANPAGPALWLAWQRKFWRQLFDDLDNLKDSPATSLAAVYKNLKPFSNSAEVSRNLAQAASILATVAECGTGAAKAPGLGKIFLRNCDRLQAMLDSCPNLSGLASFWRELRSGQTTDLAHFGSQALILGKHCEVLAKALE